MCGIVGYTGRGRAAGILLRGLSALEYRGYDSAGIALSGAPLAVFKCGGRVSALAGTDSELAAHLLALDGGDIPERLFRLAKRVKGAFTILVLREGDDKVYAYKRGASLVVSSGKTGCYVASDAAALPRSCKRATVLSDGECAVLSPDGTFR